MVLRHTYNKYLINGSGKVLFNLEDINVDDFIGLDAFLILEYEKENKYSVINSEGKELVNFPKVDNDDIDDPSVNEEDIKDNAIYLMKNHIIVLIM